jgi:hypothetical protein
MTWLGAWSRCKPLRKTNVGAGLPAKAGCQLPQSQLAHRYRRQASSHTDRARPGDCLQRERQGSFDLLALRQAHLKLSRVVNQHVLPGERFRRNQA